MSAPFPSQLTASTRVSRIAWVFNQKGEQNIWIADGPDFSGRAITHYKGDTGQPIVSLRLTPDGRTAVFAIGTEVNDDGRSANPGTLPKQPKQQVWAVDVDGGEPRLLGEMGSTVEGGEDIQISPDGKWAVWGAKHQLWIAPISGVRQAKQLTDLRGDISSPQWSPVGERLAVVVGRQDHSFVAIADLAGDNLLSIHYISPSVDLDLSPRWSPDGDLLAFIRAAGTKQKTPLIPDFPEPWGVWVGDTHSYVARQVWKSGDRLRDSLPPHSAGSFEFAANGRVVFVSEQDGRRHLYSVGVSGGAGTLLTPGNFDVEDVTLIPDKQEILYSSNQDDVDRRHLWRVDIAGLKPQSAVTRGETIEWTPVETSDGKYVFCIGSTGTTPAKPYLIKGQERVAVAPSAVPIDYPTAQFIEPKQVIFRSEDGLEIHGQLFMRANNSKPAPAVIFIHGGAARQMLLGFHYLDYYHNTYAMNEYLASQGYIVLSVNYRLGTMYGREFREAAHAGSRGASEYEDIVAAAHFLQKLPGVDAKKIGLWGGSYGGYLTALALARNSEMFAAGVDLHGVHDWSELLQDYWTKRWDAPDLEQAKQLAFESSPNAALSGWRSPVLLIHGDDDRNVEFSQTVDVAQRLREKHVHVEELVFPDEIHDFLLWKTWIAAYQATADFFDRALKKGQLTPSGN